VVNEFVISPARRIQLDVTGAASIGQSPARLASRFTTQNDKSGGSWRRNGAQRVAQNGPK